MEGGGREGGGSVPTIYMIQIVVAIIIVSTLPNNTTHSNFAHT